MNKRNYENKWKSERENIQDYKKNGKIMNSSKVFARLSQVNETKSCNRCIHNEKKSNKKDEIEKRLKQLDQESKKILLQNLKHKRNKEQNSKPLRTTISPNNPNIQNNKRDNALNLNLDDASNISIKSTAVNNESNRSNIFSKSNKSKHSCCGSGSSAVSITSNKKTLANSHSALKLLIFKSFVNKTRLKYLHLIRQHVQEANAPDISLPFRLKPSPPKRYPYNFITAVRRKLKTFLRCSMNNEFLEDKGLPVNISESKSTTNPTGCNQSENISQNSDNKGDNEMLISQNTEMLIQESEEDDTTVSSSILNGSWHQASPHRTEPQPSNAAFLQRKIETSLDEIETRTSLAKLLSDFNQRLQNVIEINEKLKCRKSNASVNRNDNNSLGSSNQVANSEQAGKDSKEIVFLNLSPTQSFASHKKFESPPSKRESSLLISTETNKSAKCDNFDVITQSSFDLSEQLTNREITKADQLKLLLKIREKLLVDRAKSKIAWMELQKERLKSKGLKFQVSATKKKQRSILIKMENDLKQMKRLFKSNEQNSETSSIQSQTENSSSNHSKNKDEKSKSSEMAALSLERLSNQLPLSLQLQELKNQPERMHHRMLRLLKYIDNSLIYLTEDENTAHVEYVYTTGAKLNKLWKRLTMQNVEQFESNKWYKLCRNDFKQIYQEAKGILTLAFAPNEVSKKCSSSQSGKMNLNVLRQLKPHLKRDIKDLSALKLNAQNHKQLKIAIIRSKDIIKNATWSSITKLLHRIQSGEPFFSEMTEYVAAAISFNTLHAESMLNLKYLRVNAKQMRDFIPNTHILPTVLEDKQIVEPTINDVNDVCLDSHQAKLLLEPNYKSRLINVDQPIYHNARSSEQEKYLQYSQTEKIVDNGNAINSLYIREIPNKPPPPYVPPAPGSPMTTIFPSEERIRCLTFRRSHELFCKLSNTDYVNDKGDPLPSVMSEQITNIYERIVLEICQEWMDEHKDILNKRDPCNFHTSLSLFNPPNRLRSIQNSIYKDVRYALTMETKSSNRSQSQLIYANRGKRDHIEKIIIQELFDEDQQWDAFHCNENEVLKLIIDSMVEQYAEQIVEESWNKAKVQL